MPNKHNENYSFGWTDPHGDESPIGIYIFLGIIILFFSFLPLINDWIK